MIRNGWTIRKEFYADGPTMFVWIAERDGRREEFRRRRDAAAFAVGRTKRRAPTRSLDVVAAKMVAASQAAQPGGCCAGPEWRGHLCPYHDGYADGIDAILTHLGAS